MTSGIAALGVLDDMNRLLTMLVLSLGALGVAVLGCAREEQALRPASTSESSQPFEQRESVEFIEGYAEANDEAATERKPILIFFTAPRSVFCEQMLDEVFRDEVVVGLAQKFTCIQVDASHEPDVCRQYNVEGYPTIQLMSSRGVPLERLEGKAEAGELAAHMQSAIEAVAARDATVGTKTY